MPQRAVETSQAHRGARGRETKGVRSCVCACGGACDVCECACVWWSMTTNLAGLDHRAVQFFLNHFFASLNFIFMSLSINAFRNKTFVPPASACKRNRVWSFGGANMIRRLELRESWRAVAESRDTEMHGTAVQI